MRDGHMAKKMIKSQKGKQMKKRKRQEEREGEEREKGKKIHFSLRSTEIGP